MNVKPEKWTLLLLSLIFVSLVQLNLMHCKKLWFWLYVHSQKFGYFRHWLSDKNTLEVKNFDTQSVFICNTLNYKPKFQWNPKMLTFDFSRLQIYLRPGKVSFATVPNIRLARWMSDNCYFRWLNFYSWDITWYPTTGNLLSVNKFSLTV